MGQTIKVFWEMKLQDVQAGVQRRIIGHVAKEDKERLLNMQDDAHIEYLLNEYLIEPLEIDFDHVQASIEQQTVPAERFPPGYDVRPGKSYTKPAIRYHVPCTGNKILLGCTPDSHVQDTVEVELYSGEFSFVLINFNNDAEALRQRAERTLSLIRQQYGYLVPQVAQFNHGLPVIIRHILQTQRAKIQQEEDLVKSLGVPLRRATNVPSTFVLPVTSKKIPPPKPNYQTGPPDREPRLDETIYTAILKVIHDTGKVFERLPSLWADKGEEDLRDYLIVQLTPHFEWASTTGETFNKSGKTDILLRYENSNVFVAECKFWKGPKAHHDTIDQLLRYLTWRDSKTAIVYFVPTKEIAAPLKAIEESTRTHPCFVAAKGRKEQSWFHYEFHLPGDAASIIQLAILCFHLPAQ